MLNKLLSHRLRGFGAIEHSPSAFKNACASKVPYLEVDTRVSANGEIYLFHNSVFKDKKKKYKFANTDSTILNKLQYSNGESLLSLKKAIEMFKTRKLKEQILCLDIKDYGFEKDHLDLVRQANMENNIYFVSWIPQTLVRLQKLGSKNPLILSHWNLIKLGKLGYMVSSLAKNYMFPFKQFVLIGKNKVESDLNNLDWGYQHSLVSQEIPNYLIEILSKSRGGVCIHRSMVGNKFLKYCKDQNLKVWVFSTNTTKEYLKYASNPDIDVVFCEDAKRLLNEMNY
jgi:glycerophosphoryl diester phosphodiesterase